MISVQIPGFGTLELTYLVLDYNGTLAVDGELLAGVEQRLTSLARQLTVHVLTADTFGKAGENLAQVPCTLTVLPQARQDEGKRDFIRNLGSANCASVGNGRNDALMLKESALGLAVMLREGISAATLAAADIVFGDILDALDILVQPLRLTATLRS
jgi:soluble P-type ATPase